MAGHPGRGELTRRLKGFLLADSAWAWFGLAFAGLFARRPQSLLRAEFAYEDGNVFYLGSWFGGPLDQAFRSSAGYLDAIPRLVGVLERAVPPSSAPLVSNLAALVVAALVVRFIASDRLAGVMPDRRLRWACALLVIVQPGTDMVLGSITFIQFYMGMFLVAAAVATPPRGAIGTATFRVSLVLAALTGPFSILFLPLFAARLWILRDRDARWSFLCVGLGAASQVIALLLADARDTADPTLAPWDVMRIVGVHLATGFTGTRIMTDLVALTPPFWLAATAIVGLTVLVVLAVRPVPRPWLFVAGYVWASTIVPSFVIGSDPTEQLLSPLSVSRYYVVPWLVLGILVLAAAAGGSRPAAVLTVCLAIATIGDLRLPSGWNYGWSSQASCVGGADPCDIRIFPGTDHWTFHWPGLGATNRIRPP